LQEALSILERSYDALGMTQLRDDTRRVIQASFPKGSPAEPANSGKPWWQLW
jgi:outer membrane protein assembly factor BamD